VELEIPQDRLKVVLFNEQSQFKLFAERMSTGLSSASGFLGQRQEHQRLFSTTARTTT